MAVPASPASPLFLREAELRRGIELLFFGYGSLLARVDERLAADGLGRAHHRAMYLVARRPGITVGALIALLGVTKQSLGRTLNELAARGLIESSVGRDDRRQRLLRLTLAGTAIETALFEALRQALSAAYNAAGPAAVGGFWQVLEGLIPADLADKAGLAGG